MTPRLTHRPRTAYRIARRVDATVAFIDTWVPQSVLFVAMVCLLVIGTQFLPWIAPSWLVE